MGVATHEHPGRVRRRAALAALDPQRDAWRIYRTLALLELPFELELGLNLAFYRTFAAPRIAALLARTGQLAHDPRKRTYDTGLIVYELIAGGLDSARGRRVLGALDRMHGRWPIAQEDHRYVLSAFVVVPTRFAAAWGWRTLTPVEREATAAWYRELGSRMGIRDIPSGYGAFAALFDDYERAHLVPGGDGAALLALTQDVVADRLPPALRGAARPVAGRLTAALVDDRLARCLGLRPAGPALRAATRAAFAARRAVERRRAPRTDPSFVPGMPVPAYPEGYDVGQLGVTGGVAPEMGNRGAARG